MMSVSALSEGETGLVGIALLNPPYAYPPGPRRMPGSLAVLVPSQPREAPAYAGDAEKWGNWARAPLPGPCQAAVDWEVTGR